MNNRESIIQKHYKVYQHYMQWYNENKEEISAKFNPYGEYTITTEKYTCSELVSLGGNKEYYNRTEKEFYEYIEKEGLECNVIRVILGDDDADYLGVRAFEIWGEGITDVYREFSKYVGGQCEFIVAGKAVGEINVRYYIKPEARERRKEPYPTYPHPLPEELRQYLPHQFYY